MCVCVGVCVGVWVCGCVGVCVGVCGCVGVWVCGCVGVGVGVGGGGVHVEDASGIPSSPAFNGV